MIVFSDHATAQIKRRNIPMGRIAGTVKSSVDVEKSFRGRILRRKRFGTKILEVVTVTEGTQITVITAYYRGG